MPDVNRDHEGHIYMYVFFTCTDQVIDQWYSNGRVVFISSCKSIDDLICHGRLVIVVMLDSQICWFPKQRQLFCFELIVPQTHNSLKKNIYKMINA